MRGRRGIALVSALIIVMVVFLLVMSSLYVITQSTIMSGVGKRYASSSEAADGAVIVMKDAIRHLTFAEPLSDLPFTGPDVSKLVDVVLGTGIYDSATVALTLPGTQMLSTYSCSITLERLYTTSRPGSTVRFPPEISGGSGGVDQYFRINTAVEGADKAKAESVVLYRYVAN